MADFPTPTMPTPPVITSYHIQSIGGLYGASSLGSASSAIWPVANKALFYPFRLTSHAVAYELFWWIGSTIAGSIDVGIYDKEGNRIISTGSTVMAGTVNTIQQMNITDTPLAPGDYYLAGGCTLNTGTLFQSSLTTARFQLPMAPYYEQTTAIPLPATATPVLSTDASWRLCAFGVQLRSVM